MTQSLVVQATRRKEFGKGKVGRLRRAGRIPATFYGRAKEASSLTLDPKVLTGILHSETGQNTIFQLVVDGGNPEHALIKDFQLDPVRGNLLHVDLLRIDMSVKLRVKVPVEAVGVAVGVKVGGGLMDIVHREIEVECLPVDIPGQIEVDVTSLDLNQMFRVSDLKVPGTITVLTDPEVVLVHVMPMRLETPAVEEAPAAEAAEPEVIKKGKQVAEGEEE